MRRTGEQLVDVLRQRLDADTYRLEMNEKENTLRIFSLNQEDGVTLSLGGLVAKWERHGEETVANIIEHVTKSFEAMSTRVFPDLEEGKVYPVVRATSFPTVTNAGETFLTEEHTAETRIFYSIDLGDSYRLITKEFLKERGWNETDVKRVGMNGLETLPIVMKEDVVANNIFYFLRANDGYDGSRILNQSFLKTYYEKITGEMLVGIPHQDVLIIGDIRNEVGYDVMAQMNMQFFMNGRVPITSLSFSYNGKDLEPIFILGKKKR